MPEAPSITEIIRRRFSCRTYANALLPAEDRRRLDEAAASWSSGPLGAALRFRLIAATELDKSALKGLGTYGIIRGESGFFVGAVGPAEKDLEDFGYVMERLILLATEAGLGSCWLGGFFTRSSFAARILATTKEQVPAVACVGIIEDPDASRNALIRRGIGAASRLPWDTLFFDDGSGRPLTPEKAGTYAVPLEMVRLGPSASNKQPWRITCDGSSWHFFLKRTPGYRERLATKVLDIADIQRLDMGIAMCHFELSARELGLEGAWTVRRPAVKNEDDLMEYIVSWES